MAERKLLFFFTPQFGRESGGLGNSAERVVRSMLRDYDVLVFSPSKDLQRGTYREEHRPGFTEIQFSSAGDDKLSLQFASDLAARFQELRAASAVCGFYIHHLSYVGALFAAENDLPLFLFARGNDIDLEPFGDAAFKIQFALSCASLVCCVSTEQKRKIEALYPGAHTKYLPNGVDEVTFFPSKEIRRFDKPCMGIFGDIKSKKGLDLLLYSVPFKEWSLKIVGELREESAKLLHGFLSIHPEYLPQIEHLPYTANVAELKAAYESVDLVVLPSHHEGMSNVLLESMSLGKLVLASRVGGSPDVIEDGKNGLLFKARCPESFNAGLQRAKEIMSGPEHALISAAARERILEEFTQAKEQGRILAALRSHID